MLKKDTTYYENLYLELLNRMNNARTKEERDEAKAQIAAFKSKGLFSTVNSEVKVKDNLFGDDFTTVKNDNKYHKFASKNATEMDAVIDENKTVEDEISRVKRRRFTRRALKVAGILVICGAMAAAINSCKKKDKGTDLPTTTTSYTTLDNTGDTSTTTTIESETISTSDYGFYDIDSDVTSMSDAMNGIVINDPTTGTTTYPNGGGNTNTTTAPTTTAGTTTQNTTTPTTVEPTTTTTASATATPTPTTAPTTSQTTVGGDPVPTTSIETEPAYTELNGGQDVIVNEYDDVQPSYIEEDPNETYETYIDITPTTSIVTPTTSTQSLNGMPVDEDENETYETYFTFPVKECNKDNVKRLTLIRK